MKKVIPIVIVTVGILALMVFKLKSNQKEVQEKIFINDPDAEVLVRTVNPADHEFDGTISYLGTFEPIRQSVVGADANGTLISVNFNEGDKVSQGQVLAKVDDELLRLQLASAEIGLEGVKKDDDRYSNLAKENAVAGVQVEKTKLNLRANEIQKKLIQKQIRSTNITAPFSGVITQKMIELGAFVGQGTPVFQITDISSLKLTVNVPERDVLKFRVGSTVSVRADIYGDKVFRGKIKSISVVADRAHNYKIQVEVLNPKRELMAGMYGSVKIENLNSKVGLSVPRTALVGSSKKPQVYVVKNNVAHLTSFTAGMSDGEYIEVVSGISKEDHVVVKGQVNLQDKTRVKTK